MGSRSKIRGEKGLESILDKHPEAQIELIELDVGSDVSVGAAAKSLKEKGVVLYALVNNAGVGLSSKASVDTLINTNFFGPKRVSDAFVELIDKREGRIVNVSSGLGPKHISGLTEKEKRFYTNADTTWDELKTHVLKAAPTAPMGAYGLSKAGLICYTLQQSKAWPHLKCTALTPGFIATKMTAGFGAKLTPDQGTVSLIRCLFGSVTSGHFYGSDGLRSPLTITRDPGMPEYEGEANPDRAKYNRD